MLDLLVTTAGIILIYIFVFFASKCMKVLSVFLQFPNLIIIFILLYGDFNYKKLDLWQNAEEYLSLHKSQFLPIKSINGIFDSSGNLISLDFKKTDGIFSIVKDDEYSKECLHNYYIKQTSECPMTDIILEKTEDNPHSNYIKQKISNDMYLYYTKESNLDGKLFYSITFKSTDVSSLCNENNEFRLADSTCFKVVFESNFNNKNISSIIESEEQKEKTNFYSFKKYANYCDKFCVILIVFSIITSICEPRSNKKFNFFKIISWTCHTIVLILLIIRYHKYRKMKQYLIENKDFYEDYQPRKYFNLDTVTLSLSISVFFYYILYLIIPDKCHFCKCENDCYFYNRNYNNDNELECLKDSDSKLCALVVSIFFTFCSIIAFDVMNDIAIVENYKIISCNWMQNSIQSISVSESSGSGFWKKSDISYSLNEFNYSDISKNNDNSKICGKDSKGNDLYFPKDVECPINDIFISKFDYSSEYPDYTKVTMSNEAGYLYYTNKKTTGKIVIAIIKDSGKEPLTIDTGLGYEEIDKIANNIEMLHKIMKFNTSFFYEELDCDYSLTRSPIYRDDDDDHVSDPIGYSEKILLKSKLYAINYLGVNNKLIGKVKDFSRNLDKYQNLTTLKYISYGLILFDCIYYNYVFLFEEVAYLCFYCFGIVLLPTVIFFLIINYWCLYIDIYVELILNRINADFERYRCDFIWHFLLTLIGTFFSILYVFIIIHGFIKRCECECPKKGNVVRPIDTNEIVIRNNIKAKQKEEQEKIIKIFSDNEKEEPICTICLIDKATIILDPCRHRCVCETCFNDINSSDPKLCPMCRKNIVGKI